MRELLCADLRSLDGRATLTLGSKTNFHKPIVKFRLFVVVFCTFHAIGEDGIAADAQPLAVGC